MEVRALPHWRCVDFISDMHLHAEDPETFQLWEQYMRNSKADAIFLLGDLFEVWVGDDALSNTLVNDPFKFERACAAVLLESSAKRPLYVLRGNRDFLMGVGFEQASGCVILDDPAVLDCSQALHDNASEPLPSERLLLSHGDALCLDDVDYQIFRTEVRSALWQERFLARPLHERVEIGRDLRARSMAHKSSLAGYADAQPELTLRWLTQASAATLIHGHTHRPAIHSLEDGKIRVVLSDWDGGAHPPRAELVQLHITPGEGLTIRRELLAASS